MINRHFRILLLALPAVFILRPGSPHAQGDSRARLLENVYYKITLRKTGQALDNKGSKNKENNPLKLTTPYGNFHQQWALVGAPRAGHYYILHRETRKCLGVSKQKKAVLKTLKNLPDRQWNIRAERGGFYLIRSAAEPRNYLTYIKGDSQPRLKERNSNASQSFRFSALARANLIAEPKDKGEIAIAIHAGLRSNTGNKSIRLRKSWNKGAPTLSYWLQKEDGVLWHFKSGNSGKYKLHLELSCPAGSENSTLAIRINGVLRNFKVPSTNSWGNYQYFQVAGLIPVKAGTNSISIQPENIKGKAALNLRGLVFLPKSMDSASYIKRRQAAQALAVAVDKGDAGLAQKLLAGGADINRRDSSGYSPLHVAVSERERDMIRFLIKNKANLNLKSNEGYTPLILAVRKRDLKTVEILAKGGADLNARGGLWVEPPIITAIGQNRIDMVQLLLTNGANPDRSRKLELEPPLHITIRRGQKKIVRLLLDYKANPNLLDYRGYTALIRAIIKNDLGMVKDILRVNPDINQPDGRKGLTALHHAVTENQLKIVQILLKRGAALDRDTKNGAGTPLWYAAYHNRLKIGRFLLKRGANIFLWRGKYGTNPYEIAVRRKHKKFARMLKSSVNPRVFKGWVQLMPMAGVFGLDFWVTHHFDHNPRERRLPSRIEPADFIKFLKKASKGRRAFYRRVFPLDRSGKFYAPRRGLSKKERSRALGLFHMPLWRYKEFNRSDPNATRDYMGNHKTYDGHGGTDYHTSNENRDLGYPVFAVADGYVLEVVETDPRPWGGGANVVRLLHPQTGGQTRYWHINRGILVKKGQLVRAGQQVAWVGGGGTHMHFTMMEWNDAADPHRGPANNIVSRWKRQRPYTQDLPQRITNWGLFDMTKKTSRNFYPRPGFYQLGRKNIRIYARISKGKKGTPFHWEIYNPRGQLHKKIDQRFRSNNTHNRNIDLEKLDLSPGRWKAQVFMNNKLLKEFSFDVIGANDSTPANRAPRKPSGVTLETIHTPNHDVFACRVKFPVVSPDPDLNRVEYRYSWTLNGKKVREVAVAPHRDYFSAFMANKGDRVRCEVRTWDRQFNSAPVSAEALVSRSGRMPKWFKKYKY